MPKHKTLAVLERRIEETQACLMRAKARYDRLTQELQALHIEHDRVRAETIHRAFKKSGKSMDELMTFLGC